MSERDLAIGAPARLTYDSIGAPIEVQSGQRILELDGLRGIAALSIVQFHYFAIGAVTGPLSALAGHGWVGVDCFFVLSGFLIVGILLDSRDAPHYFSSFYVRRLFRIFPLYYLLIALVYVSVALFAHTEHELPPAWIYGLHVQNFYALRTGKLGPDSLAISWSLAIEEHCYLVLPLLVRLMSRRALAVFFAGMVMGLPLLRGYVAAWTGKLLIASLVTRADGLFVGALIALLVRNTSLWGLVLRRASWVRAAFVILVSLNIALIENGVLFNEPWLAALSSLQFTLVALLFGALLLTAICTPHGAIARVLRWRPLRFAGLISYGIYIYHQFVSASVSALVVRVPGIRDTDATVVKVVSIGVTFAVACASWYFFERPLIAIGHRMTQNLSTRDAAQGDREVPLQSL